MLLRGPAAALLTGLAGWLRVDSKRCTVGAVAMGVADSDLSGPRTAVRGRKREATRTRWFLYELIVADVEWGSQSKLATIWDSALLRHRDRPGPR